MTEERQKLLETLKYLRDNEVKTKRKEKEELAVTEQKLILFQQKYKQTFTLPQFIELEKVANISILHLSCYKLYNGKILITTSVLCRYGFSFCNH